MFSVIYFSHTIMYSMNITSYNHYLFYYTSDVILKRYNALEPSYWWKTLVLCSCDWIEGDAALGIV